MIKTKECKIIYKQCKECGKVKFYKKFGKRKGKNRKLYFKKICHSCVHNKRKNQLNYKEICDICGKEYSCNYQEHNLLYHFCSEECKNIYEQKQHEQYYTIATCSYCKKEYEVLTSTYNRNKEGTHFCSKECCSSYMKETRSSKETFECENCGKELIKNKNTYNPKAKHHFCSKECREEFNSKKNIITLICSQCNKEFTRSKNNVRNSKHHFCSQKCANKFHNKLHNEQNAITLLCSQCGQEFTRYKSAFKEAEHYFCSQKCRNEYIKEHNKKYCIKCNKPIPNNRKYDLCSECLTEKRHNEKYIKFNCAYCGKESEHLKVHTKGGTLFCSRKCMGLYRRNNPTKLADVSKDPKIVDWSKKVISKFNNTCIKCGKHFDKGLNAHHLNSKDWDKDNIYNVDNGVPLCNECHQDYHMLYGYGNNTEEQFLEWYNEYLDED